MKWGVGINQYPGGIDTSPFRSSLGPPQAACKATKRSCLQLGGLPLGPGNFLQSPLCPGCGI